MALHILCIDDEIEILNTLQLQLEDKHRVSISTEVSEALVILKKEEIDAVLLDVRIGNVDGVEVLKSIKKIKEDVPVVMLTGQREPAQIVEAMRAGASDYFCKPYEVDELFSLFDRIERSKNLLDRNKALLATLNNGYSNIPMMGKSKKFCRLVERANMVKGHDANILICGESGTGKELLARYIHRLEKDPVRPFIAVNCAAIPENLIESELFGHEKGAFTGAVIKKIGKFELANDGDIFLDEISSLKLDLQAKILRTLQERAFMRVGGNENIYSKFRVIAATNVSLEEMVCNKTFRMDLFHRLRVVTLQIPPLRERYDDISELTNIFLQKHSRRGDEKKITPEAMQLLHKYNWPGNIRELENLIHSLIIMSDGDTIGVKDLPHWLSSDVASNDINSRLDAIFDIGNLEDISYKEFVKRAEREYVKRVLDKRRGNRAKAAEDLNIGRSTFYIKLRELGLS